MAKHNIRNYQGYKYMSEKQQSYFENMFQVIAGGNELYFESADQSHLMKFGKVMMAVARMDEREREIFIKNHWVAFEEIFENSEYFRSRADKTMTQEDANNMIDMLYNDVV